MGPNLVIYMYLGIKFSSCQMSMLAIATGLMLVTRAGVRLLTR